MENTLYLFVCPNCKKEIWSLEHSKIDCICGKNFKRQHVTIKERIELVEYNENIPLF